MWTRTTTDPLGKLLFDKYGMHILSRPRENVSVFDVFPVREGEASMSGGIDSFLRAPFERPEVAKGEVLLDIDSTISEAVSGNVAVNFLQGFLALLGAGVVSSVSAAIEASQSHTLRFRFGGCCRDHVKDVFELDWKLSEVTFVKEKSAMREGYRYYVASAVHYCSELTFEILDKNLAKIDMSANVAALGSANSGLAVNKDRQLTAKSDKRLAYGVELNEIVYDEKCKQLQLQESRNYVHVKAGTPVLAKAMLASPQDLMVLPLSD